MKESNGKRLARLSEAYMKELSQLILYSIRDQRLKGVYITHVVFTPDLRLAKAYFHVDGGRVREQEVIDGFESSKGFIKRELNTRVNMKYAPDIKFYYDETDDVQQQIDRLFDQITPATDEKIQEN